MRILMLNNEFPPLGGGTGTVNQALFTHFKGLPDLTIDLVTSALGKSYEQEQFSERITLYKVPVNNRNLHHSSNRELLTYAARALPLALRLHRQHPYDLCFAWSAVPAGGVAWMLRTLTGLPYLVRVSGPDIPGFERRYRYLYPFLTPFIRSVWRRSGVVVAKCQSEVDMIHAVDWRAKVIIIPNGVDLEVFHPGEPFSDNGPLRLLCVARLIERKGQPHLIHAVKKLVDEGFDLTLDLIGEGDSLAGYRSLTRQLGLTARVRFLGYISRQEMPEHYCTAHVFVLPSYNEGMSVATLEAMAAGLPLIATNDRGGSELIIEGKNGYSYDFGDIESLTDRIRLCALDRMMTKEMGEMSRVHASNYSWNRSTSLYLDLLHNSQTRFTS
jgi:phosphatidyl-myo-inositol dimannoside synthase